MATDLPQLEDELGKAREFEQIRIQGYNEILALSGGVAEVSAEVREGLAWSAEREQRLGVALEAVVNLMDHGYPARVEQIAPATVIAQIQAYVDAMTAALHELHEPPVGAFQVGPEVRVNA